MKTGSGHAFNRRHFLLAGGGLGASAFAAAACQTARPAMVPDPASSFADLSDAQLFDAYIKLLGTLDTSDVYIWFKGVLWGGVAGGPVVPLCGFQGLARHRWEVLADGTHIQKAYDVGFFSEIDSVTPADTLVNPLTNETVRPYHNTYGGSAQRHTLADFTTAKDGGQSKKDRLVWDIAGDKATLTERSVGEVPSRLQPDEWPRESTGPVSYYSGEFSYATRLAQLLDPAVNRADYALFWSSFSPWEPWLLMDGQRGVCQWRATGTKLRSYEEASSELLEFVARVQPNYFDDADPWEGYVSSLESFKRDRRPERKLSLP